MRITRYRSLMLWVSFVGALALAVSTIHWTTAPVAGQTAASGQPSTKNGEWPHYTADLTGSRYSPLDQINGANFSKLEVAWRFKTDNFGPFPEFKLEGTPLMVKGVLYTTAGTRRSVIALDAKTGELIWSHSLREGKRAGLSPRQLSGRGVAYWTDGRGDERILYNTTGYRLVALNAKTGQPITSFGNQGVVDLKSGAIRGADQQIDLESGEIGIHSTPTVAGNVGHRRRGVPRRDDRQHAQQHQGARSAPSTCAPASSCGGSTRFRGPASSATTRGKRTPGPTTATPACGRRSASTRSSGSPICRSKRRRRISTAAIGPATTSSPRRSSRST